MTRITFLLIMLCRLLVAEELANDSRVIAVVGELENMKVEEVKKFCGEYDPGIIVQMIKKSDIMKTYNKRITRGKDGAINLDYHWLEKGCSFQVDLIDNNGEIKIKRIWLCR